MIRLARLRDGGHILEHPAGPIYVTVKHGKIIRAELAPWGEPTVITWPRATYGAKRVLLEFLSALAREGVRPAV